MGCDIHAYLNYFEYGDYPQGIKFRIGRDYDLFTLLANVRGSGGIFKPKGLCPVDLSWTIKDDLILNVYDKEEDQHDYPNAASRESSDKWHENYLTWKAKEPNLVGDYVDDTKKTIYHPDWHSHSWLDTAEMKQVVDTISKSTYNDQKMVPVGAELPEGYTISKTYKDSGVCLIEKQMKTKVPIGIKLIYENMKILEEENMKPKFVFWFDN